MTRPLAPAHLDSYSPCVQKSSDSDNAAEALGMHNMNGVFIVLLCGSTLATLIGIGAWFADTYRRSKMYNASVKTEHTPIAITQTNRI